jgi:2-polyprenyl-6-methoxyphenol hydroxylase-like FAD-dependent oxidoreductase
LPAPECSSSNNFADIIVVGGGLAGAAAAAVLGGQGRRVTLIDARAACPPVFKAEKIESDQAQLLRKFGLLESLLPGAGCIREIRSYYNDRLFRITSEEQYGLSYRDMVNPLRERLPATVQFKVGHVAKIANSADLQRVSLDGGEQLTARLVVVACGLSADIPAGLGLKRISIQKHQSVAIAFTIARPDARAFDFDSMTCFPTSRAPDLDYLTFFPIGQTMRANLFAFPAADGSWTRRFIQEPERELERCFPNLRAATGEYRLAGKIETSLTHLYRTEGERLAGVVLIGDAAQNVCPSTGMGLTKVLTDVDVLCSQCVPRWFETAGMGSDKMARFYDDPRKRETDEKALRDAIYRRKARIEKSLRWRIHRARLRVAMRFESLTRTPGSSVPKEAENRM